MKSNNIQGKKLLILAGTGSHLKLAKAAKELGVYTIVVDYLEPSLASPAKYIADECWDYNVLDVDGIVRKCKKCNIDGVITGWNDISQVPYYQICEKLNLPSYGSHEQFLSFTNKKEFKTLCKENGIDVIDEYSIQDIEDRNVIFPVFVKPVDSRGSRGQSVCNNYEELEKAIIFAQNESFSGEILIERYVANTNSFQVTYFFIDGEAYIIRTADGYKGRLEDNLDRVALCSISPSIYTDLYLNQTNDAFVNMLKKIGIKNGPVMAQGFYDQGVFRFYDPGLRFPGVDYEIIYRDVCGIDLMKMMVEFALTGKLANREIDNNDVFLKNKKAAVVFPVIESGEIGEIDNFQKIINDGCVHSALQWYEVGEIIETSFQNTSKQRIAEIDLIDENWENLKKSIKRIQKYLEVKNNNGKDMIYKPFDVERIVIKDGE